MYFLPQLSLGEDEWGLWAVLNFCENRLYDAWIGEGLERGSALTKDIRRFPARRPAPSRKIRGRGSESAAVAWERKARLSWSGQEKVWYC
jgi:hypothetical protein